MAFYAVANGRTIGIFLNWNDCNNSVKGYKNALYKKFDTKEEADMFIQTNKNSMHVQAIETENSINFITDYYVYTDGACSNNGKDNALSGIGIFFGINDMRNISKKIEGKQTNNTAELSAIIQTYSIIENDILNGKKITIVSDSEYAIKCVSTYGEKCDKTNVQFMHVKAHTNNTDMHSIGNDNADKLANMAIGYERCPYNKPH